MIRVTMIVVPVLYATFYRIPAQMLWGQGGCGTRAVQRSVLEG
jgi:hypothetical protein